MYGAFDFLFKYFIKILTTQIQAILLTSEYKPPVYKPTTGTINSHLILTCDQAY
jgi:hypothetical protein